MPLSALAHMPTSVLEPSAQPMSARSPAVTEPQFGESLEHMMMTVLVTYHDGATEPLRFEGATDWDVKDGHLVAWNETGDVVAERDNIYTADYQPTLAK